MNKCCAAFFFIFILVCVRFVPLWQLWRSNLLPRGVDVADHKVLGDLLHVLIIEESVEAKLVCRRRGNRWQDRDTRRKERGEGAGGERMEGWTAEECDHIKYASSHSERTLEGGHLDKWSHARSRRLLPTNQMSNNPHSTVFLTGNWHLFLYKSFYSVILFDMENINRLVQ